MSLTVGTAEDAALYLLLSSKQKYLAAKYDWPWMKKDADVAVTSRYATLPLTSVLNYDRPFKVTVLFDSFYYDLDFGIGQDQYNFLLAGETQDPVRRWDYYLQTQFEVWPTPVTSQTVRFTGQKALSALSVAADTADLDDLLLVYSVAAEKLMRSNQKDAEAKQALAQDRLAQLRGNAKSSPMAIIGGGQMISHRPTKIRLAS